MEVREIGNSGLKASSIALGAWAIGGGLFWGESDDNEAIRAILTAIDHGITMIDTAPAYGFGHSEEVVGKALQGKRDKVILSNKCGLWWDDDRGSPFSEIDGRKVNVCLRPETINIEIDLSLKRLNTDYIDLYMTHWQSVPPDKTPIEDTMAALLKLKDAGKIRVIGVSNAEVNHMKEYLETGKIDSNQLKFSILDRKMEKEQLQYCIDNSISIQVYSPLEQGLLTGTFGMDYIPTETEYRNKIPWFGKKLRIKVLTLLDGWKNLTDKYNCTLSQLVIAWTAMQPGITFVLCGSRKAHHVIDNVKAADITLSEEDAALMRKDAEALGEPE
ncbi:MAG: aldo/keto reductase [Spirochaetota bacterium]|nr:MAG: aldo/keto reductase [Spirochaetota bacterium]